MPGLGVLVPIVLLAGLFFWFRSSGGESPTEVPSHGRFSLLSEAVGYVGALLLLAGGIAGMVQRWDDLSEVARVALLSTSAVVLLGVGFATRRSDDPAAIRLTGVLWLLSTAAAACALAELTTSVWELSDETAFVLSAAVATAWAGSLYTLHRRALQHLALYGGILVTAIALLLRIDPEASAWIGGVLALAIGLGWIALGERRLVPPWWVAIPVGMLTALFAPLPIQESSFGAMFAVGVTTAAALMAFGVHARLIPALALGSLGLFAYVTGAVVHFFGDTLGVPAALAMTGGVILLVAALTTRLARSTHPAQPKPS